MKKLLIAVFMLLSLFVQAYEITVYGRNSCGFTANLRAQLDANLIPYTYCNIDSSGCLGACFAVAIEFNLAVDGVVNLPVVLVVVEGKRYGYVRPSFATILQITAIEVTRSPTIVYPNPAGHFITVAGDAEIFDLTGIKLIDTKNRTVDISGLKAGVYLIRVGGHTIKLVKR